jgi:hypothetical protein
LSLCIEYLNECRDHIIESDYLFEEVNALSLEVLGLSVFVRGEDTDLVILVEGNINIYLAVHF